MSLKLNRYIASVNIINYDIGRLAFNVIFSSFGVLILCYVFLLGNMVNNIIERQSLETRARALTNEVRNLEVAYLSMSSDIDLDLAYSIGFKNTQTTFATRKTFGFNSLSGSLDSVKTASNDI